MNGLPSRQRLGGRRDGITKELLPSRNILENRNDLRDQPGFRRWDLQTWDERIESAQSGANVYSLAPNNVALKSILIGSWFRLPDEEKQKDFELALNLAKSHPTLFQVGHEFEFDDYLEAIRDVFRPGKPESSY